MTQPETTREGGAGYAARQIVAPRLQRWQLWLIAGSCAALWVSGAAWLLLFYFFRTQGQYGAEVHPAEPLLLEIHGAVSLMMVLAVGGLLVAHVPKGWSYVRQRPVGIVMLASVTLLLITSHFLRYTFDDDIRSVFSKIHWIAGLGLPVWLAYHWTQGRKQRAARQGSQGGSI